MKQRLCSLWVVAALAGGPSAMAEGPARGIRSKAPGAQAAPAMKPVARLKVGDPAPALSFSTFLKGEPIQRLEKGRLYLLEFWATWCTPCKMLTPHLSKVAKAYQDRITVLGVDVAEQGLEGKPYSAHLAKVQRFMKGGGMGMDYAVAMDDDQHTMEKTWLEASQGGFPAAVLVDRDGRVAWVGYPGEALPAVLDLALEGKLDGRAIHALEREEAERQKEQNAFTIKVKALAKKRQYAKALEGVENRLEDFARKGAFDSQLQIARYSLLTHLRPEEALKVGEEYLLKNRAYPVYLTLFAMSLASGESFGEIKLAYRDAALALKAARLAYELNDSQNPLILHDLAAAYAVGNDFANAVKFQEMAVASLKEYGRESQEGAFLADLKRYRAKAGSTRQP